MSNISKVSMLLASFLVADSVSAQAAIVISPDVHTQVERALSKKGNFDKQLTKIECDIRDGYGLTVKAESKIEGVSVRFSEGISNLYRATVGLKLSCSTHKIETTCLGGNFSDEYSTQPYRPQYQKFEIPITVSNEEIIQVGQVRNLTLDLSESELICGGSLVGTKKHFVR